MTKFWGPLGWMTLHSISVIYPETPSVEEKAILRTFMELFRDTITCQYCKEHFRRMYTNYITAYPGVFESRASFFQFVARAHNTVNLRLDKPRIHTVSACLETLVANTKHVSSTILRNNYINYLANNWGNEFTGEGAILRRKALEMKKINDSYWTPRDSGFDGIVLPEMDVVSPIEKIQPRHVSPMVTTARVGFTGGRLRLGIR